MTRREVVFEWIPGWFGPISTVAFVPAIPDDAPHALREGLAWYPIAATGKRCHAAPASTPAGRWSTARAS
jgi:hypothetical protein